MILQCRFNILLQTNGFSSHGARFDVGRSSQFISQWANYEQFPYQVSITSKSNSSGVLTMCSGSVISYRWILTAASCVTQSQVNIIRFGAITHYTGGITQTSRSVHIHPNYSTVHGTYDAALLEISSSISSAYVKPVVLPFAYLRDLDLNNRVAIISGWGLTPFYSISPVLQYGYGHILNFSHPVCRNLAGSKPNLLCASLFDEFRISCIGDIGSPLVVQVNRTIIQVGITFFSMGEGTCRSPLELYTDIIGLRNWISDVTRLVF